MREAKTRLISAAPFRDRVVHHALCAALSPIFERRAIFDSYACRPGKGHHRAIARAQRFCRSFEYVLKLDVERFFESADHGCLKRMLRRAVKDERALWLSDRFIDLGAPGAEAGKGLPIGNLTSQHFANFYLDGLDHLLKDRLGVKGYVRYMDDLLVFGADKKGLWRLHQIIAEWLKARGLRLKRRQTRLAPVSEGVGYLGHWIFPGLIRLDRALGIRLRRKLLARIQAFQQGEISAEALVDATLGLMGATLCADAHQLRRGWVARCSDVEV